MTLSYILVTVSAFLVIMLIMVGIVFTGLFVPENEGFMRASPQTAGGQAAAAAQSFWGQFGLTLLFNLGVVSVISIVMNFNQVKGIPAGYVYPLFLAVTSGLIGGTNSFIASDITRFNARDGMALALSIGNLEMLGYIFVIVSTVKFGVYQYSTAIARFTLAAGDGRLCGTALGASCHDSTGCDDPLLPLDATYVCALPGSLIRYLARLR